MPNSCAEIAGMEGVNVQLQNIHNLDISLNEWSASRFGHFTPEKKPELSIE